MGVRDRRSLSTGCSLCGDRGVECGQSLTRKSSSSISPPPLLLVRKGSLDREGNRSVMPFVPSNIIYMNNRVLLVLRSAPLIYVFVHYETLLGVVTIRVSNHWAHCCILVDRWMTRTNGIILSSLHSFKWVDWCKCVVSEEQDGISGWFIMCINILFGL